MFNLKHYNKSNVYIDTIDLEKLENISTFQSQLNWWLWQLTLSLNLKITNTDFEVWEIIKVYYKSQFIYSWAILDIKKSYGANIEDVELIIIWYASLLTRNIFTNTYSDLASNIAKDIIDKFNVDYGTTLLSYDVSSIPATVWTVNIVYTNNNYFEALEQLWKLSWCGFFVDKDWKVYFKEKWTWSDHILTLWKDVDNLEIVEEGRSIINSLILKYNWWSKTYTDSASVTLYWLKEKYEDKSSSINNLATADIYGASFLSENAEKVKKISIILNNNYNYFWIKSWDNIRIRNSPYIIENLQIQKINFAYDKASLELEKSYSFAKEIFDN